MADKSFDDKYKTFDKYYRKAFLKGHTDPDNRFFHWFGFNAAVAITVVWLKAVSDGFPISPFFLAFTVIVVAIFAELGHFFFENKNPDAERLNMWQVYGFLRLSLETWMGKHQILV